MKNILLFIAIISLNQWTFADIIVSNKQLERMKRQINQISGIMIDVQKLQMENRHLRGMIEEQKHQINTLKRRQREFFADIDERLEQLSKKQPPSMPEQFSAPQPMPVAEAASALPRQRSEQGDYQRAYKMLTPKQRKYRQAIIAFEQFINDYPQSKSLPNAYYWLGEGHYVLRQNNQALNAFQTVIKRFPNSLKTPAALLKMGYLQLAEGQSEQGQKTLLHIIKRYPSSSVANMARKRLNQAR